MRAGFLQPSCVGGVIWAPNLQTVRGGRQPRSHRGWGQRLACLQGRSFGRQPAGSHSLTSKSGWGERHTLGRAQGRGPFLWLEVLLLISWWSQPPTPFLWSPLHGPAWCPREAKTSNVQLYGCSEISQTAPAPARSQIHWTEP